MDDWLDDQTLDCMNRTKRYQKTSPMDNKSNISIMQISQPDNHESYQTIDHNQRQGIK